MSTHISYHLDDSARFTTDCEDRTTKYGLVQMRRVDIEMSADLRSEVSVYYRTREQVEAHITALCDLFDSWPMPRVDAIDREGADIPTEEVTATR